MRTAKEAAEKTIKRLERERMSWFEENAEDQGDYVAILKKIEAKKLQVEVLEKEILILKAESIAKASEMTGENKAQIEKFDKLIAEAEKSAENI